MNDTVERTSENVRTAAFAAVPTFSCLTGLKKSVTAKEFCRAIDVTLKILRDMVKEELQEYYADKNEEVLAAGQLIS
ncbi:hypothetical protein HMI56_002439 [Coelomomyces lativittatus]|nr:hypothetical protein HMI56_002439 [Coelomomyces lativittatus]